MPPRSGRETSAHIDRSPYNPYPVATVANSVVAGTISLHVARVGFFRERPRARRRPFPRDP
eukprot:4599829-Prymnesium_polylepis.2